MYDGLVVVGGDGTFHEVLNGMLQRTDGLRLPLGLIGAGSTDATAHSLYGSADIATAALQIILGDQHPIDVGAVIDLDDRDKGPR